MQRERERETETDRQRETETDRVWGETVTGEERNEVRVVERNREQ